MRRPVPDAYFRRNRKDGWTYLIQSVNGGPIKIGATLKEPSTRLQAIQNGNPEELRIIDTLPGIDLEPMMHRRYREWRIRGEWFEEEVLELIYDEFPVLRAIRGEGVLKSL